MKIKNIFSTLLIVFLISVAVVTSAQAYKVEIIKLKERSVALPASSPATEFSFTEIKKKVIFNSKAGDEVNYLTDVRAAYRTKKIDDIESVAIVQWIKGCQYESVLENNRITKNFRFSRDHFGKIVPFQHLGWEIDSESEDPIYSSFGEFGRHALLRWNINKESLDPETAIYYADKRPEVLRVFVTDLPGTAFTAAHETNGVKRIEAKNTSLEFKTCLFLTKDLPIKTDPKGSNILQDKALSCFKWDHKFVYNFKTGKFNSKGPIDPFCFTKQ